MAITRIQRLMSRSLRLRVLALVLAAFALLCVPAWFGFTAIVNSAVIQLGTLIAEKQVLYDRYRGLEALMREVSLAETLAGSQAIRDWASDEADPQARRRGIAELEHFRQTFADNSYFFVMDGSGNYYFNDAANSYAGQQYRYTLDPDNPRDGWYYRTRELGQGCHLNVDHDDHLRVTKVWMNCVIREGARVLGILGTGLDLTSFIRQVVDVPQPGVNAIFVDRTGAIQAHRDPSLVDFHSLTKAMSSKSTIFSMLDLDMDREALRQMMDDIVADPGMVESRFMQVDGRPILVGVGYLDRLGWFNVTLMDIDEIIDRGLFLPVGGLLAAVMIGIALTLVLIFNRSVLNRLADITQAVAQVEGGQFERAARLADFGSDEIGRLGRSLATMARSVGETTRDLERRVGERTSELERLAYMDVLTGIPNRRGLALAFERGSSETARRGLILVDLDFFKQINDAYGHAAGDAVVIETARRLNAALGPADIAARWGGDEFIVLVDDSAPHLLRATAYRILAALNAEPFELPCGRAIEVTASVGASLVEPSDSLDMASELADAALYMAKSKGRNTVVTLDRELHTPAPARATAADPA